MNTKIGHHRGYIAVALFLFVFAIAFFRLPFFFSTTPSASASYAYQFNNRIAVLVFLAGALLFAILFRGLSLEFANSNSKVRWTSAALAILFTLGLGALFLWLWLPFGLQKESVYLYNRLNLIAHGHTLYRDFEFPYGPLMLYPALWLTRLFHTTLTVGYFLTWLAHWALGIWILYRLVNSIEIPSRHRTFIFYLLTLDLLLSAIISLGLNYTALRPLLAAGMSVPVFSAIQRREPPWRISILAILCATLVTSLSPEYGISFMCGTALFFAVFARPRTAAYVPTLALMCAGFLLLVLLTSWTGAYSSIREFSTGGYNFPVLPTPDVLVVLALFFVAACVGYQMIRRGNGFSRTMYLLCICLFGLPSSFGRADSGHMQIAAFPAIIIAALALSRYTKIAAVTAVLFAFFNLLPWIKAVSGEVREQVERRAFDPLHKSPALEQVMIRALHLFHQDAKLESIRSKEEQRAHLDAISLLPEAPDGIVINAPWGLLRNGYPDDSGRVDYGYYSGYFSGLQDAVLPAQVDSIVRWLQGHPDRKILVPEFGDEECGRFVEADAPQFRRLYGLPYATRKRQVDIYKPLCNYVATHYLPDATRFSPAANLWHPVPPDTSSRLLPNEK